MSNLFAWLVLSFGLGTGTGAISVVSLVRRRTRRLATLYVNQSLSSPHAAP